jgi:hypothetical protein
VIIQLYHCLVRDREGGVETVFPDGAISTNIAPDDVSFLEVATQCGFKDPVAYVREHDLAHSFLAEKMFGKSSPIVWAAAHNLSIDSIAAMYEERWVYHWQRFTNGRAGPMEWMWSDWLYHWRSLGR